MPWTTLLDEFNTTGRIPDGIEIVSHATGEAFGPIEPIVRCLSYRGKRCNRQVRSSMMIKIDGIYICDGCMDVLRMKENIPRRDMADRMGGPRLSRPVPTRPYKGGRFADDL